MVNSFAMSKMSSLKEGSFSVNSFSVKLYSKLIKDQPKENLFYSPTSVCVALAMTYAGAKGNTAKEVEQVMHWDLPETVHTTMKKLQESFEQSHTGDSGIEISLANRLWAQEGFSTLKEFTETLQHCYQAEMGTVNFTNKTEHARQAINKWVEEKTKEKIKDLLKEDVLTSETILVLTNAVYFKGSWQDAFSKSSTHDWDFKVSKSETTKVKLMNKTARFMYAKSNSLSCQVLKLPYKQEKVAMMILLPDKVDGLAKLEEKVTANQLKDCDEMLAKRKVFVSIPKFRVTSQFNLKSVLGQMGIHDLFSPNADLSGITGNKELFVSEVVHQAFVDVNEEGTEAAAATAVLMARTRCAMPVEQPARFLADHPFMFVIQHCESGAVLFVGRIVNPSH